MYNNLNHNNIPLTAEQIIQLERQGCSAQQWSRVSLAFSADYRFAERSLEAVVGVRFYGDVVIGEFCDSVSAERLSVNCRGVVRDAELRNVELRDCIVGRGVLIENVSGFISRYIIEDGAVVSGGGLYCTSGTSTISDTVDSSASSASSVSSNHRFGVGVRVAVLCEAGGREVAIYPELSVHVAYMMAMYRYRPELIDRLYALVDSQANSSADHCSSAEYGCIGAGAYVAGVGSMVDVNVGAGAVIDGASRLCNGTVGARSVVEWGAVAQDFIVAAGGVLGAAGHIERCFIGQGAVLGNGFTAHDSLFFSNSVLENGEACSVFAGPYTVSMHKSTLMIGGLFSFANFGSGSNQSNHLYKLGPLHQGVVERGAKFASDSYLMFPAHVGAFSMIMGRHKTHFDSSEFPFSYLISSSSSSSGDSSSSDITRLVPGVALGSAGTIRDAHKWPLRDKRTTAVSTDALSQSSASDSALVFVLGQDYITFNLLNPYTVGRMMRAIEVLSDLLAACDMSSPPQDLHYKGCVISVDAAARGLQYYNMAVDFYFAKLIKEHIQLYPTPEQDVMTTTEFISKLSDSVDLLAGDWVDLGGLITPKIMVQNLINDICSDLSVDLSGINNILSKFHENYSLYQWQWALPYILAEGTIAEQMQRGQLAADFFRPKLISDGAKEFSTDIMVGFGLDAHSHADCAQSQSNLPADFTDFTDSADSADSAVLADFTAVRGSYETNTYQSLVRDFFTL